MVPALADHLGIDTVLIGTNPPGENEIPIEQVFFDHALKPINDLEDEYYLFFDPASEKSRRPAKESHERIGQRLERSSFINSFYNRGFPEIYCRFRNNERR